MLKGGELAPAPAAAPAGKRGRGGGGRGGGRKRSFVNTPGTDDPSAPKKVQATLSLGGLLGFRVPKNAEVINVEAAAAAADGLTLTWQYVQHGGDDEETLSTQRQLVGGRVLYDIEKDAVAIVLAKGPESYYVDKDDESVEVDEKHVNAMKQERHGGQLKIQMEKDGERQEPQSITLFTFGHRPPA